MARHAGRALHALWRGTGALAADPPAARWQLVFCQRALPLQPRAPTHTLVAAAPSARLLALAAHHCAPRALLLCGGGWEGPARCCRTSAAGTSLGMRQWQVALHSRLATSPARGTGGGGGNSKHVQLNKDIIAAAREGEGHLCSLVQKRRGDFNAINAATAYKQMIFLRRGRAGGSNVGAGGPSWESSIAMLEEAILKQHVLAFGAQAFANVLHALAKNRTRRDFAGAWICVCVCVCQTDVLTVLSLQRA